MRTTSNAKGGFAHRIFALLLCVVSQVPISTKGWAQGKAQGTGVNGVAFDSLHNVPLDGAMVRLLGTALTATSDSRGRFHFDGAPVGRFTLTMLHPSLDSIGLNGISRIVVIAESVDTIHVAIPSFATFWMAACGSLPPPADGGFIYGTVRFARTDSSAPAATVALDYSEYSPDSVRGFAARNWSGRVLTDRDGSYAFCGVPTQTPIRIRASTNAASSAVVELPADTYFVRRRDLYIVEDAALTRSAGVVVGIVQAKSTKRPIVGARVSVEGSPEVRTGTSGRFVLRSVPLGTRQVDVISVGSAPMSAVINVRPQDTTSILLELESAVLLDGVRVRATSIRTQRIQDMEKRREQGFGHFMDSTEVRRFPSMAIALSSMKPLGGGFCAIYIDGVKQVLDSKPLAFRSPADFAQLEVHTWSTPMEYRQTAPWCPVLLAWTKNGLP